MRILIVGASGFIGGRLANALHSEGHNIVVCGRNLERLERQFPFAEKMMCELASDGIAAWRSRLLTVDAVINAAGIFSSAGRNNFERVHASGPRALFEACAAARISKLIQISALGADASARTPFYLTKRSADDCCLRIARIYDLSGWVIIRPSLVIGRGGASTALFSAMAALPLQPRLAEGTWELQPIHISDFVHAVMLLLERNAREPAVLDLPGPKPMTTDELTDTIGRWLRLRPRPRIALPEWLLLGLTPLASVLSLPALSRDGITMLKQGNKASLAPLTAELSWTPSALDRALEQEPSSEADLWHARLFFLRPFLRLGLALLWIVTAICSAFIFPVSNSATMVSGLGVSGPAATAIVYAGAAVDALLGGLLLLNIRPALVGVAQIATVAFFTIIATIAIPYAWIDPLGPLTKNAAVILATLVMIALEAER